MSFIKKIDMEDRYQKKLHLGLRFNKPVLGLHLKRQPNSCFVNNYFDINMTAWQANMDIQPVFHEYKAVTYMCQSFSRCEDQCSETMKQTTKKVFENKCITMTP